MCDQCEFFTFKILTCSIDSHFLIKVYCLFRNAAWHECCIIWPALRGCALLQMLVKTLFSKVFVLMPFKLVYSHNKAYGHYREIAWLPFQKVMLLPNSWTTSWYCTLFTITKVKLVLPNKSINLPCTRNSFIIYSFTTFTNSLFT